MLQAPSTVQNPNWFLRSICPSKKYWEKSPWHFMTLHHNQRSPGNIWTTSTFTVLEDEEGGRDIFIFCCFSSLRWSDVHNLKKANLVNDCICITQQKTSKTVTIELNKYTRAILEKYQDVELPGGAALPVVSNQKMNDAIKVLFKMAGLDKPTTKTYFIGNERRDVTLPLYERISTHVGRKTFVVTGLSSGLSPYTITQWTGHSSLKAMKPYMALADKVKKESMKKFDEV